MPCTKRAAAPAEKGVPVYTRSAHREAGDWRAPYKTVKSAHDSTKPSGQVHGERRLSSNRVHTCTNSSTVPRRQVYTVMALD